MVVCLLATRIDEPEMENRMSRPIAPFLAPSLLFVSAGAAAVAGGSEERAQLFPQFGAGAIEAHLHGFARATGDARDFILR